MDRVYSGKRSLSRRWIQHIQDIHHEKLKNIKPTVDISCPPDFSHLRSKAKKEQQKEGNNHKDRFTEIERANRLLLEKMSSIMNSKTPQSLPYYKRSLNTEVRKKNMEKIAGDNLAILKRLKCRTPVYSIQKWEKEWRKTEKRLQNMGEFPYRSNISRARTKSSTSRSVLYKKGITIDNHYFLVEITKKLDDLRIIIYDPSISESYSLSINFKEALEIMGGKEDFDLLTSLFRIKNDEIILVSGPEDKPSEQ